MSWGQPPFEVGEPVKIVNVTRLWLPDQEAPIPIELGLRLLGCTATVIRCHTRSFGWHVDVLLYGPHPDKIHRLTAERSALRKLSIVDAVSALENGT